MAQYHSSKLLSIGKYTEQALSMHINEVLQEVSKRLIENGEHREIDSQSVYAKSAHDSLSDDEFSSTDHKAIVLLSIDAMMDPEHVRRQNEEFEKFGKAIVDVAKELLMIKKFPVEADDWTVVFTRNQ